MINITTTNNVLSVSAPYNPNFPPAAKLLNGKWNANTKCWQFDARDEARVRELCQNIYGEGGVDGGTPELVTIRIKMDAEGDRANRDGLYAFGRQLAYATGRDSGARLSTGVIVLEGGFKSGGSCKNWETVVTGNTVVEIKDVPACKLDETHGWEILEVIPQNATIDTAALQAERERLMARINEIDAQLSELDI